jgi:hypothetical protein
MQTDFIVSELERNRLVFLELLIDLPEDLYLWKSAPEKWCLLEIIGHLIDEEVEDFRVRTIHALNHPQIPLQPIDPQNWPQQREYLGKSYQKQLERFSQERIASVDVLRSLQKPDWLRSIDHPNLGVFSAGKFLANWLAHDYLHIRQINRVKYNYFQQICGENLAYAGDW